MDERLSRRRVLALCGSGMLTGLAGCSGDDTETNGTGDESDGRGPTDGTDGGNNGIGTGGVPTEERFFDQIRWETDYRFEFVDEFGRGEGTISGGDLYVKSDEDGMLIEMYRVDGTMYMIEGGVCQKMDIDTPGMEFEEPGVDFDEIEEFTEEPSVEHIGTDTIDGETVNVYEITYPEAPNQPERMYILESGYIHRIEAQSGTTDFFDWGTTQPIEPPDIECTEMGFPGGEDSDYGY